VPGAPDPRGIEPRLVPAREVPAGAADPLEGRTALGLVPAREARPLVGTDHAGGALHERFARERVHGGAVVALGAVAADLEEGAPLPVPGAAPAALDPEREHAGERGIEPIRDPGVARVRHEAPPRDARGGAGPVEEREALLSARERVERVVVDRG